jgi:integrase
MAKNGRVKPNWVVIDGEDVERKDGTYYIDWNESGKRIRQAVGADAQKADLERQRQESILNGKAQGMTPANGDGTMLVVAIDLFLDDYRISRAKKTWQQYRTALDYFKRSCKKRLLSEITRRDLLQFTAFLREQGLSPRTVANKFEFVMTFLKAQKVTGLLQKGDWPRYTEDEPEIYEPEELEKFFAECDPTERLYFTFFLQAGMREQEVMHCSWDDVNLAQREVHVRYKPQYSFNPKAYKAREIPIPDSLAAALKIWKGEKERGCGLLFPTKGCRPKLDFLDTCKAVAERAGLDPSNFWLHKFRATFATTALRKGVDLRTVQKWMGHSDMESTMRYLKPNRGATVRGQVNAMWN